MTIITLRQSASIVHCVTSRRIVLLDQPRSGDCGVVYNFGPVCLSVCLYVCLYVCQTITFESLDIGSLFSLIRYIVTEHGVKFVYKGKRVRVNVTGVKNNAENPYSRK